MRIMIFIISVLLSVVLLAVYEISILVMIEYTDLNQKQAGMFILLVFSNYCVYNKIIEDIFRWGTWLIGQHLPNHYL